MKHVLVSLLALVGFAGAQETSAKTLELHLLVNADAALLFNHVYPLQFTLSSEYGSTAIEATGQVYAQNPDIYYQTLEPLIWRLELPGNSPNDLKISVTAELALCDQPKGICYLHNVALEKTVDISQASNQQTLNLMLTRLEF
jgi:hypothetical protein